LNSFSKKIEFLHNFSDLPSHSYPLFLSSSQAVDIQKEDQCKGEIRGKRSLGRERGCLGDLGGLQGGTEKVECATFLCDVTILPKASVIHL
jgi:hypothetical protein